MRRKIDQMLVRWKSSPQRKPLVVHGARQVGKTYSVLEFGARNFGQVVHLDFSAQKSLCALFDGDITPDVLIPQIEVSTKTQIEPDNTLLFFDEVQMCPRALTSLKYFYERAPQYHIIAAGSLLGISLKSKSDSFPVGKINLCYLHPLDFEEFAWAQGEENLCSLIRQSYQNNSFFGLHEYALDLYQAYLLIGGMPEIVKNFCDNKSFDEARTSQETLLDSYVADMTKYATPLDSSKILGVWQGIPEQLSKENHKFQYKTISSSARAHQYESAINWLKAAGMIGLCYRVKESESPLPSFAEHDFFKIYLLDVGLLSCLQGVGVEDLLPASNKSAYIRGGIAENYVFQQLVSADLQPFYWGTTSKAEVDFIVQTSSGIVPIEVKSGKNVTSRSLESFRKKYLPPFLMRVSTRNFGFENGIKKVPLYALFCIGDKERLS